MVLQPDVAAPGVSILAAYPPMGTKHGSGYAFLSGTSMACPHATGMVALIKSAHPDWSPAAIRSALVTTVSQKGTDGMDITEMGPTLRKADPFDIGGGHVNPNRAINPGLIYNISKQDYIQFIGISSELLVVALVQVNGDQDMFVVSVLLQKKIYRSDLQLEMALQQQQFEQQPQCNVEQPTVSSSSRLVIGPRIYYWMPKESLVKFYLHLNFWIATQWIREKLEAFLLRSMEGGLIADGVLTQYIIQALSFWCICEVLLLYMFVCIGKSFFISIGRVWYVGHT